MRSSCPSFQKVEQGSYKSELKFIFSFDITMGNYSNLVIGDRLPIFAR